MTEWTPITESLPEIGQDVLVDNGHGCMTVLTLYEDDEHGYIWEDDYGEHTLLDSSNARAWMPLPKPYEYHDNEEDLLSCPFCGGKAHIMDMGYPHWVYCEDCGAKVHGGVVGEEEGEKASIAAWNRRDGCGQT